MEKEITVENPEGTLVGANPQLSDVKANTAIVTLDPWNFAVIGAIGPFVDADAALAYAEEDHGCQKDWAWTIVDCQFPTFEEVSNTGCNEDVADEILDTSALGSTGIDPKQE